MSTSDARYGLTGVFKRKLTAHILVKSHQCRLNKIRRDLNCCRPAGKKNFKAPIVMKFLVKERGGLHVIGWSDGNSAAITTILAVGSQWSKVDNG